MDHFQQGMNGGAGGRPDALVAGDFGRPALLAGGSVPFHFPQPSSSLETSIGLLLAPPLPWPLPFLTVGRAFSGGTSSRSRLLDRERGDLSGVNTMPSFSFHRRGFCAAEP